MRSNSEDICRSPDVPERVPHLFTENQWAWAFRNRHSNGLDRAVTKVGSRYFVNIPVLLDVLQQADD